MSCLVPELYLGLGLFSINLKLDLVLRDEEGDNSAMTSNVGSFSFPFVWIALSLQILFSCTLPTSKEHSSVWLNIAVGHNRT